MSIVYYDFLIKISCISYYNSITHFVILLNLFAVPFFLNNYERTFSSLANSAIFVSSDISIWGFLLNFGIPDKPPCYVRQWSLVLIIVLNFFKCLGFYMCYISLYGALSLHNCSSSGSLVFAHLGSINKIVHWIITQLIHLYITEVFIL